MFKIGTAMMFISIINLFVTMMIDAFFDDTDFFETLKKYSIISTVLNFSGGMGCWFTWFLMM